ncbi:DUF397 domain-containing protein [Streptomyces prasinus]|uniref:DUF397 domain-containing protein n=1 Tax=Streptomyces prasinus TaxID=67345 RepID=UPI00331F13CB
MMSPDAWQKSSFSGGGQGDACVEVAPRHSRIAIRDSKNPARGILTVPATAFAAFVGELKRSQGRQE